LKEHIHGRVLHVVATEHARTKSGKRREIPVNEATQATIDELLYKNDTDFIMPRMNFRSLLRSFDRDVERLDRPGSLYWLRRTFCAHYALAGTPIRAVQQWARHSRIEMTERNSHVSKEFDRFARNINFGEKQFS